MDIIHVGKVLRGKIALNDQDRFDNFLKSLEGQIVQVIVRKPKTKRTNQQNKWYWSCVVGIPAEHYGYLPEEMHEAYKFLFLRKHEEGKPETVKSTTELSTKEFAEYCEQCRIWAAQQGFNIPSPDEVSYTDEDYHG